MNLFFSFVFSVRSSEWTGKLHQQQNKTEDFNQPRIYLSEEL